MDTQAMRTELLSTLDEIEQRKKNLDAEIVATSEEITKATTKLSQVKDEITKRLAAADADLAAKKDAALRIMREIEERIVLRRAELNDTEIKLKDKKALHDQVDASLDSIRKMVHA